jgi:hypothetical protein
MPEEGFLAMSAANQKRVAAWMIRRLLEIAQTPESGTKEEAAALNEEVDVLTLIGNALGMSTEVYREAAPEIDIEMARLFPRQRRSPDRSSGGGTVQ